jgi:hypothetical protein
MDVSPEPVTPATPSRPTAVTGEEAYDDYTSLSDLELILRRDHLRVQLDELTVDPGASPVTNQLLVNIDEQIDRMTDELTRRALSRHPASPGPARQRYRLFVR